jgi:hypothetical protein
MKNRVILTMLFALVTLISGQGVGVAEPGNIASRELLSLGAVSTPAIRIDYEYGCGWDYPCPPRPNFGRRSYRPARRGSVVIHNNYGTVNIYMNGQLRHRVPKYRARCSWGWCDIPRYRRAAEPEACETDSCKKCGLGCWYRRMKRGYCGHGCDWYREAARIERAERAESYRRHRYFDESPSSEFQKQDDEFPSQRYSRRRYDGPPYPP